MVGSVGVVDVDILIKEIRCRVVSCENVVFLIR